MGTVLKEPSSFFTYFYNVQCQEMGKGTFRTVPKVPCMRCGIIGKISSVRLMMFSMATKSQLWEEWNLG